MREIARFVLDRARRGQEKKGQGKGGGLAEKEVV